MDKKETLTGNGNVAIHDWEPYTREGIHKNAEEIEHDIEDTRHVMDEILDNLTLRINPGNFVNRMMNSLKKPETREKTRDAFYDTVNRVSSSFQRNPLPLMIVAAGITWQLWEAQQPKEQKPDRLKENLTSARATAESRFSETGDKIGSSLSQAKENLKGRVSSLGENARNAFKSNEERAHHKFDEMQKEAKENQGVWQQKSEKMQDQVSQSFRHTAGRTDQIFHDNPLLFGFAAIFAGLFVGGLFPETKSERNVLGEKSEDVVEKATEQALSKGREASRSFAQKANTADLTPENTANREEQKKVSDTKPQLNAEKQQPVTPVLQQPPKVNQSEVLKTAEQKIDEKKDKS